MALLGKEDFRRFPRFIIAKRLFIQMKSLLLAMSFKQSLMYEVN